MYYILQINETMLNIFMEDTETHHISVMPFRGRSQTTTFIRGGEQVVQKCWLRGRSQNTSTRGGIVYHWNHSFGYWNRNPNWPILSTNTVTETTIQRENLVANSVGYFFLHKSHKTRFDNEYSIFLDYFWRSGFI